MPPQKLPHYRGTALKRTIDSSHSVVPNRSRRNPDSPPLNRGARSLERGRLARECAKLNKSTEQRMADEGLAEDLEEWPEF